TAIARFGQPGSYLAARLAASMAGSWAVIAARFRRRRTCRSRTVGTGSCGRPSSGTSLGRSCSSGHQSGHREGLEGALLAQWEMLVIAGECPQVLNRGAVPEQAVTVHAYVDQPAVDLADKLGRVPMPVAPERVAPFIFDHVEGNVDVATRPA